MVQAPQLVLQQQWRLRLGQAGAPLLGPPHLGMAQAQHPGQRHLWRAPAHQMGQLPEMQHLEQAQALRPGHWPVLQPQEQAVVQSGEACPTRPLGLLRADDPALLQLRRSPVHAPQAHWDTTHTPIPSAWASLLKGWSVSGQHCGQGTKAYACDILHHLYEECTTCCKAWA